LSLHLDGRVDLDVAAVGQERVPMARSAAAARSAVFTTL
jgi:hypothetical protein